MMIVDLDVDVEFMLNFVDVDVHVECSIVVEMWIHVEIVVELVDYHCNLHVHD